MVQSCTQRARIDYKTLLRQENVRIEANFNQLVNRFEHTSRPRFYEKVYHLLCFQRQGVKRNTTITSNIFQARMNGYLLVFLNIDNHYLETVSRSGTLKSIGSIQKEKGMISDPDFHRLITYPTEEDGFDRRLLSSITFMQYRKGMICDTDFQQCLIEIERII